MAKRLEDLPVYSKVLEFWDAVSAILRHSEVRRNRKLFDQIDSANDSIDSNMKEGFEQPTDAAFANFVFTSKGSSSISKPPASPIAAATALPLLRRSADSGFAIRDSRFAIRDPGSAIRD
jgi:hypothetical protein